MSLNAVTLDDKYTLDKGRVYLTGMQALVRLPMLQQARDAAAGLKTGGFISGYRGSPLGNYDQALWQARPFLEARDIKFQPGVNEDLAATSVWGTQQLHIFGQSDFDGVFGIWYGKGPGVDRSGDAFKHGNYAGTSPHGGALLLCGDDHTAKSSTTAHQSEQALIAAMIPVFNPASIQEYLDYGQYAFELSRFAGCWVGMKCLTDTVESSASVFVDPERIQITLPDYQFPEDGVHIRWPDGAIEQEARMLNVKLPAVQAFIRANRLDRVTLDSPKRRFGIVSTGKAWSDVMLALAELGIGEKEAAELGLSVYKVAMPWPLEGQGVREFAEGLDEILVVEEKRDIIEDQLARHLYDLPNRPKIVGKRDEAGKALVQSHGALTVRQIAQSIATRLLKAQPDCSIAAELAAAASPNEEVAPAAPVNRMPWFCSGCPHNSSTKVPEGSRAMAGIGCHTMAVYMPNRRTATYTHMGAEGANWIGQAPFSKEKHVFQNLGDGTYFHSGIMAIRAAVAAGVNITYKLLFNDAVAMTGGQPIDGQQTPWQITRQLHAEGVAKIVVVTDEPGKYPVSTDWAPGVAIRHRDELDAVQRTLREVEGTTILLYDQVCAAEKRRRRKRGTYPDPAKRAFINDLVCEGCGDCGVVSNCVSVKPLETDLGRKRVIDQSSCNKDYSCINGFCPSFVTVEGGTLRRPERKQAAGHAVDPLAEEIPLPVPAALIEPYNILVTGIGGTGVVTVGALLGMAAHLEEKGVTVLDQTGLAQKNGAVMSHVRLAGDPDQLRGTSIPKGQADLILGCDMVVAAGRTAMDTIDQGRTKAVVNSQMVPVATFALMPDMPMEGDKLVDLLAAALGKDAAHLIDANGLATSLMGDAIATNLFLVGYAFQKGLIPLGLEAIHRAIELNAVAVDFNKRAFAWGRKAALDLDAVQKLSRPAIVAEAAPAETLDEIVARRVSYLTDYQNAAYARRYEALVRQVEAAEKDKAPARSGLALAVARYAFKLMAYKDEYEVARLYTSGAFEKKLRAQFEGGYKLKFHMAPPLLARRDEATGQLKKAEFGPWALPALRLLARFKGLRGTALDIFGRTQERKTERRLITDYEKTVAELLTGLNDGNHKLAVQIAEVPEHIRGFGHVKERHLKQAKANEALLLDAFRNPSPAASAAE